MRKDRREIIAIGELALFLATWALGLVAVLDDYRGRVHHDRSNDIAATSNVLDLQNTLK